MADQAKPRPARELVITGVRSELGAIDAKAAAALQAASVMLILVGLEFVQKYVAASRWIYACLACALLLACIMLLYLCLFRAKPEKELVALRGRILNSAVAVIMAVCVLVALLIVHAAIRGAG